MTVLTVALAYLGLAEFCLGVLLLLLPLRQAAKPWYPKVLLLPILVAITVPTLLVLGAWYLVTGEWRVFTRTLREARTTLLARFGDARVPK